MLSTVVVVPLTVRSPETERSCDTVTFPLDAIAIASVSLVCPMFVPLIMILSTVSVVNVPREVTLPCAAVESVPAIVPVPL